jgi:DNA-directed RNA polymerase specialized sigma24 family protein
MTESLPLFNEVDQLRREVRDMGTEVREELQKIRTRVESTVTRQNAELALTLGSLGEADVPREVLLHRVGMTYDEIGAVTGAHPNTVRMRISRWNGRNKNKRSK